MNGADERATFMASPGGMTQALGRVNDCHGKQVTNNTIFGEFPPRAAEIVDSQGIVRIMPARHLAHKNRVFSALEPSVQDAKESDG